MLRSAYHPQWQNFRILQAMSPFGVK